jgi:hypothetical protein
MKNRPVYWGTALRAFASHPVAGVGLGRYPRTVPEYRPRWVPLENAHNTYLQMLAEGGGLVLGAFLAVIGGCLSTLARGLRSEQRRRAALSIGLLVGITAFALTMISGQPLANQSGQVLWGGVLGLAFATAEAEQRPRMAPLRRLHVAVLMVVAAVFVAAALRTAPPPAPAAPWGYSWGMFPEEQGYFPVNPRLRREDDATRPAPAGTQVTRFRWTGEQALIELRPPRLIGHCVIAFAALLPSVGTRQTVRLSYGEQTETIDLVTSDPNFFSVNAAGNVDASGLLTVRIDVSPSFVPARLGLSNDTRRLGVQIFPITCQ